MEFDYIGEVARCGEATVENLRLRCRAHNQYTAECRFGAGLMEEKREKARQEAAAKQRTVNNGRVAEEARSQEEARPAKETGAARARAAEAEQAAVHAAEPAIERDLISALRTMPYSADEVRRGVTLCRSMPGATLDQQIRAAFTHLCRIPIQRQAPDSDMRV